MYFYQVLHQRIKNCQTLPTIGRCIAEHLDIEGRFGYNSYVRKLFFYVHLPINYDSFIGACYKIRTMKKQTFQCMYIISFLQADYPYQALAEDYKRFSAFNVVHLVKLCWFLIHDQLLESITKVGQQFSKSYISIKCRLDMMSSMNIGKHPGIELIDKNAIEVIRKKFGVRDQ